MMSVDSVQEKYIIIYTASVEKSLIGALSKTPNVIAKILNLVF